ncbi:MAG: hypothetical protein IVW51_07015 [Thermaceae bacterium]|nr:hypothetical protein [Thermaceae bacterium]
MSAIVGQAFALARAVIGVLQPIAIPLPATFTRLEGLIWHSFSSDGETGIPMLIS